MTVWGILEGISGLGGVTSLLGGGTGVFFVSNPSLPTCAAQGFVDQLEDFEGTICIAYNLLDDCPDNTTIDECYMHL